MGNASLSCGLHRAAPSSIHRFHVVTDLAIPEVVRVDGTPAKPGELGRLVMTNLTNFVMPLIRYDTGDLATLPERECECGSKMPYIENLVGRSVECFQTASGIQVSPVVLGHHLFVLHDFARVVRHFQLIQEATHRATLLVVPTNLYSEESTGAICGALRSLLARR